MEKTSQKMIWQKISIAVYAVLTVFLMAQNFIFSDSFAILHLREIDDLAFQASLRNIHHDISSLHLDGLFKINDYGYGWIFWILVGVVTYPFYLLALVTDCFVPLIVMPRMLSLAFVIGTAVLVYKSLSVYSKNEFLKFIAMMLLISMPAYGYFGLRFGTVAQVMFFSALTFYLTVRKETYEKKDLKHIAIVAGLCVGTKLNGALILPLIGFIMANKMQWKLNQDNFKKAAYFLLILVICAIIFSNPSLLVAPFKPKYFFSYAESLKNNSHLAFQDGFWKNSRDVLEIGYLNFYVFLVAVAVFFSGIFRSDNRSRESAFIGLWLLIALSLLVKIMSMGSLYIINYILVIMYLSVFAMLSFERWGKIGNIAAVFLLIVNLFFNHQNINSGFYSVFKYFQIHNDPEVIAQISASEEAKKIISDPKENPEKKVNVLMDFRAIFPYANLERDNVNVQFSFDNLQIVSKQLDTEFDYISLSKKSPSFFSEQKFLALINGMKDQSLVTNQIESRKIVQNLIKNGELNNTKYRILLDKNEIIFFAKQ